MQPELILLTLNFIIISIAYLWVYPKVAGANLHKITVNDLIASITSLVVAGSLFWGSGYAFNMILFEANWFWFTLISYLIIEIPFLIWYLKHYKVLGKSEQ